MATAIASSVLEGARTQVRANPPQPRRLSDALRELGYDSYTALADLVDNSIDAHASTIDVTIAQSGDDIVIEIADNGDGMDEATLDEALRMGSETHREENDLGKFGMGLVTASISLSKQVEVFTRAADGELLYGGFDLEEIDRRNEFLKWISPLDDPEYEGIVPPSGTRIRLSNTDRISNRSPYDFANILRRRLGQTFRKFIKTGVKITVNGKVAEAIDPLMLDHPDTKLILEDTISVHGGTISIRVVDLPDLGQLGNREEGIIPQNSGYYILRNNREIMEAETFDFYKKHPDYSHFRAEISFEGSMDAVLHTDVKKMVIKPEQSTLDKIRQLTYGLITASGKKGRARANATRGDMKHDIAEGVIQRRSKLIPKPKGLLETRKPRGTKGTNPKAEGERQRTPHTTELKTLSGLRAVFNEGDYGDAPFYSVRQEGKTVTVTYNREHPLWREIIDHADDPKVVALLDYLVFGMANAELLLPEQARVVKEQVNATLVGLLV